MGPILYGFICDLASNLGEVLHADEYVLGLDKQRTSEMHLRSFSLSLSSAEASLVSLSLSLSLQSSPILAHSHTEKTFNDQNSSSSVWFKLCSRMV